MIATREKILAIGAAGAGKSFAWLSTAKRYPDHRFFAIDTDDSVPRMLSGERFQGLAEVDGGNVVYLPARDWEGLQEATAAAVEQAVEGDWIIVDRISLPWDWIQAWFGKEIYGQDPADYVMMRRQELADKGRDRPALVGEFGQGDWVVMKKVYFAWLHSLVYLTSAHLFAATTPKRISDRGTGDAVLDELFGAFGMMPAGEKTMSHIFHSIFVMVHRARTGAHIENGVEVPGCWEITTVRDRERDSFDTKKLRDFGLEYVRKVARVE